jgi:DNA-binding transcriptional LysR family regulator
MLPDVGQATACHVTPLGACPACKGFGRIITIDYDLAIPDRSLTLAQGDWVLSIDADERVTPELAREIRAAIDDVGLAFMLEEQVAPHLPSGALVRVLEEWCPPFAGYFLYYPSRRQQPAALSALIDTLRLQSDAQDMDLQRITARLTARSK